MPPSPIIPDLHDLRALKGESSKLEPAVRGINTSSTKDCNGIGVKGESPNGFAGVLGQGGTNGVCGMTACPTASGVVGQNSDSGMGVSGFSEKGIGVLGRGGGLAGQFEGNVLINGKSTFNGDVDVNGKSTFNGDVDVNGKSTFNGNVDVNGRLCFSPGGDCVFADFSEDFDISAVEVVEPGCVMVLNTRGELEQCRDAYDKKVAGVVSGAGIYRPAIVLDKCESKKRRFPIALMGKVFCKVDARHSPVEVGDLLTTSPTPGHAMKAADPIQAFGSVIGKALHPLRGGHGLIPILIALQ